MATSTSTVNRGGAGSNEALAALLQMLQGGGTPEFQRSQQQRMTEINRNRATQGQFSKEAAFADAQGAINQILRQAMEGNVATLTRSAEGAGTSQSSMRALMTQDALTRAAESGASLGLNAATAYGGVSNQLAGILEGLTRPDNSNIEALLATIKSIQDATQTTESEAGGGGSSGGGVRGSTGGSSAIGMPSTDNFFYRPGGILANAQQQRNTAPATFGPALNSDQIVAKIQAGLSPSQPLSGVPNINELYTSGIRF